MKLINSLYRLYRPKKILLGLFNIELFKITEFNFEIYCNFITLYKFKSIGVIKSRIYQVEGNFLSGIQSVIVYRRQND